MKSKPRYQPGEKIGGRYQVHQALMGGMGEVYLCLDLEENYPFALKTFQQRYLTNPRVRELFEKEVATWIVLEKHPNIVRCSYLETLDNLPFMLLEWIASDENERGDLRSWLRRGPLDMRLALEFTIDICRGLLHAQQKQSGIVHRDLKPDNILIAQGKIAKITDFGLAKVVKSAELEIPDIEDEREGRQSLVGTGGIVGTPPYMAPEQWYDSVLDVRTDIYALGCILYEMLTGHCPFQANTIDGLRRQHLEAAIPILDEKQPFAGLLNELLTRCLAKRCEDRFDDVNTVLHVLENMYQEQFGEQPHILAKLGQFTPIDYANRGITFRTLKQYDKALADFHTALQLDPDLAEAYVGRGATYYDLQEYENALTDYDQAIRLNPSLALAYNNRGLIYHELQQYDNTLDNYNKALQLDPALTGAYSNRGIIYYELQRYHEALADYTQAIRLNPYDAKAYTNRGIVYHDLQQHEEALANQDRAIQLDPTFALAYFNRGTIYHDLQRYEEALADYKQAIQLDVNYTAAYVNIGSVFGNQGKLQEALPYFEKAEQLGSPQGTEYAAKTRERLQLMSEN